MENVPFVVLYSRDLFRLAPIIRRVSLTSQLRATLYLPEIPEKKENPTIQEDLARSFQLQMKYVMPAVVFVVAYFISAAVALYWLTSNIFAIGQEFVIRKQVKEKFDQNPS